MFKKLIALMLVLLMVVPLIVSCDDKDTGKDDDGNRPNYGTQDAIGEDDPYAEKNAEIDEYIDELALAHKLNGKSFVYIGGGAQAPDPDSDGETGDVQKDAFYFRSRDIEDKFGLDWTDYIPEQVEGASGHAVVDAVNQDVLAGSKAYDAGYGTPVAVAGPLFRNDSLADASEYTVIDFERDWWPAALRDTYHINGAVYFLNGPIVSSNYTDTHCVVFNKQVADDYGIEDLYQLVRDDEWTYDKMIEVASAIPENANGAGAYRYMYPNGMATLFACGFKVTQYDSNGAPFIADALPTELSTLADKFSPIFSDDTQTVHTKGIRSNGNGENFAEKYDGYEGASEMFDDDKVLFYFVNTGDAAELRKLEVDFGILPLPKGSDTQEDFISYVEPWSAFNVFIPKTTKDPAVTDVVLEAMAALGERYIKPALYDTILKGRSVKDFESKDMLDIIFQTKTYDIIDFIAPDGDTNADSTIVKIHKEAIQESSGSLASQYFLQSMLVNRNIKNILASIEK